MIVFDLRCASGHRFEGWFGSSSDFRSQQASGLIECPQCGSGDISKAPMAPAVPAKGNQHTERAPGAALSNAAIPPDVMRAMQALAAAQAKALEGSRWVGGEFAEQSRAMHYGERDLEVIHGKATLAEAKELLDEGIAVSPLPFAVAESDQLN